MSAGDFCAATDIQAFLSLAAGQDDALLAPLCTAVTAFIVSYLSRNPITASYTEKRHGQGGDRMLLRNYPITAISSLTVDGVTVPASTGPTVSGYLFDDYCVYLRGGDYCFSRSGPLNVVIGYTAGLATVPADLKQAAVEIVSAKYKRRGDLHVSSKVLDGQQITFNMGDVPPSAKLVLNQYQRAVQP